MRLASFERCRCGPHRPDRACSSILAFSGSTWTCPNLTVRSRLMSVNCRRTAPAPYRNEEQCPVPATASAAPKPRNSSGFGDRSRRIRWRLGASVASNGGSTAPSTKRSTMRGNRDAPNDRHELPTTENYYNFYIGRADCGGAPIPPATAPPKSLISFGKPPSITAGSDRLASDDATP